MPSSAPLLCELHAHTTFSDGSLTPAQVVDLYGTAGFDVLAITDHVRPHDPTAGRRAVHRSRYARYLEAVELDEERALRSYGMLVIPGLELTYEDQASTRPRPEPDAHARPSRARGVELPVRLG
jgi:histidinol phosphatase-like PHP family hydrolase